MMAKSNNPCRSYLVSQIINLPLSKISFLQVENKTILHLEVKYHIEMFEVEISSLRSAKHCSDRQRITVIL